MSGEMPVKLPPKKATSLWETLAGMVARYLSIFPDTSVPVGIDMVLLVLAWLQKAHLWGHPRWGMNTGIVA